MSHNAENGKYEMGKLWMLEGCANVHECEQSFPFLNDIEFVVPMMTAFIAGHK